MLACASMIPTETAVGRRILWTMRSTFEHDVRHADFSEAVSSLRQVRGQAISVSFDDAQPRACK